MRRERAELEGQMRAFVSYMQTYSREQGGPAPPPELMMPPRPPPGDVFSTPVSPLVSTLCICCVYCGIPCMCMCSQV
jgi:hypothetical protein